MAAPHAAGNAPGTVAALARLNVPETSHRQSFSEFSEMRVAMVQQCFVRCVLGPPTVRLVVRAGICETAACTSPPRTEYGSVLPVGMVFRSPGYPRPQPDGPAMDSGYRIQVCNRCHARMARIARSKAASRRSDA